MFRNLVILKGIRKLILWVGHKHWGRQIMRISVFTNMFPHNLPQVHLYMAFIHLEIFTRILFSGIALKELSVMLKTRLGHDLPIYQ